MDLAGAFSKYKNIFINIGVILLSLLIAFNFVYKKQQAELAALQEKKQTEEKKNVILDNISLLEKKIDAYTMLLAKKDSGSVISSINEMAKSSGVKIVAIRPGQEQQSTDYIKTSFDLTLQVDSYHALGRFISRLESYGDVYVVDSVEMRSDYQAKGLSVNLRISSIAYKKS
jgi:Tfp pilus assembly protein PilO